MICILLLEIILWNCTPLTQEVRLWNWTPINLQASWLYPQGFINSNISNIFDLAPRITIKDIHEWTLLKIEPNNSNEEDLCPGFSFDVLHQYKNVILFIPFFSSFPFDSIFDIILNTQFALYQICYWYSDQEFSQQVLIKVRVRGDLPITVPS